MQRLHQALRSVTDGSRELGKAELLAAFEVVRETCTSLRDVSAASRLKRRLSVSVALALTVIAQNLYDAAVGDAADRAALNHSRHLAPKST